MPSAKNAKKRDPIKPWFDALESTGEFIGIRFGRIAPGSSEVEWIYIRHTEYDGLGGLGHMLRERGARLDRLPQITHDVPASWLPFFKSLFKLIGPRIRHTWKDIPEGEPVNSKVPPRAVAWHAFSKDETKDLLACSRRAGVTLNTYLLKHLDLAVRPDLENPHAALPWMIPVNLRGQVRRECDTENHTSYIAFRVDPEDEATAIHEKIFGAIARGEHWAGWLGYSATQFAPRALKRLMIRSDRVMSQWNLAGFSNLGVWDAEEEFTGDCGGTWLFCPPVLRCQMVGVGCMTFQGRLTLTAQVHPELTTSPAVPAKWIERWLASLRQDSGAGPREAELSASHRPSSPESGPQRQSADLVPP